MKKNSYYAAFGLLLLLMGAGCEKRSNLTETASNTTPEATEATSRTTADRGARAGREPIQNTTPEGSEMDPSSNAYIVFDGSGSMSGEPIEQAKRAVTAFVAGAPEDLNIGLVVFDRKRRNGSEVVPLGRGEDQREQLKNEISRIQAGGGTPLGSAIKIGTDALISQFQKQLRYGDIRLIVVTDGAASDQRMFQQSIGFAQSYHVPIYTIGFRIRSSHPLRQFSEAYFTASDEAELLGAMEETLAELDDSTTLDL